MTPIHLKLLLAVFVIHFVIFARIAWNRRRNYHFSLVLVFVCLILMTALRLWAPGIGIGRIDLWSLFRWSAWAFTLAAALQWLWHRYRRC